MGNQTVTRQTFTDSPFVGYRTSLMIQKVPGKVNSVSAWIEIVDAATDMTVYECTCENKTEAMNFLRQLTIEELEQ